MVYEQKSIRTVFINDTFVDSYSGASAAVDDKWDDLLGGKFSTFAFYSITIDRTY